MLTADPPDLPKPTLRTTSMTGPTDGNRRDPAEAKLQECARMHARHDDLAVFGGDMKPHLLTTPLHDFMWSDAAEPHASRRRQILKDHPEV